MANVEQHSLTLLLQKGSEQLRALLNNPAIVTTLDSRDAGVFNWNQVFHSARTFFLKVLALYYYVLK